MSRSNPFAAIAYRMYFPIITLFLTYVGLGYYVMISSQFPGWPPAALIGACLLAVAVIYYCVRHTGLSLYEANTGVKRPLVWLPWFAGLFIFSGYGFLTSSMLIVEGHQIAKEEIKQLMTNLGQLEEFAEGYKSPKDFSEFRGSVDNDRTLLINEIKAQGNCGIGTYSRTHIDHLSSLAESAQLVSSCPVRFRRCTTRRYLAQIRRSHMPSKPFPTPPIL